jgi:serine/threonine protein kinase
LLISKNQINSQSFSIEINSARILVNSSMLQSAKQIGRYKILSPIGAGGMGEVFLAEDTSLARRVALKILPVDVAQDPERLRRFVQEAKVASALNHPNIITIHEIGETEETYFIVTEYIEGETLR